MHKIVPSRKVKSRLRVLLILSLIFFTTLSVCAGIFTYSLITGFHILSPLGDSKLVSSDLASGKIKEACATAHESCQQIDILPDGSAQLTLTDGTIVLLSLQKSISSQLASLQKVASQLTIKGRQLKKIDFRFDNVVVSF